MACFTRPELKVERVSYEVMTPSAARGVLEAILWKPAICWQIERIHVLAPIRWGQLRRNEVNSKLSERGDFATYCADEDRAQRNTLFLRDVDYVVEAHFRMTEQAGPSDSLAKFTEMFVRRLKKGQHFHQPYLGCREFAAHTEPAPAAWSVPEELQGPRPLGLMLLDIAHNPKSTKRDAAGRPIHICEGCTPRFFEAKLVDGVLDVHKEVLP
jgi:CRISPR-associated protein Cas5d